MSAKCFEWRRFAGKFNQFLAISLQTSILTIISQSQGCKAYIAIAASRPAHRKTGDQYNNPSLTNYHNALNWYLKVGCFLLYGPVSRPVSKKLNNSLYGTSTRTLDERLARPRTSAGNSTFLVATCDKWLRISITITQRELGLVVKWWSRKDATYATSFWKLSHGCISAGRRAMNYITKLCEDT